MSKITKIISTHEYNAVISTASKYVEGLRFGSIKVIAEAFHKVKRSV